jgi:BetI-type transcriptional repressor, C-terminal
VVRASRRWRRLLEREVAAAVEAGELPAAVDPADVAFELNAIAAGANCDFQLTGDREALDRALRSMRRVLGEPGAAPAR